ncbi:amiloride-sensitive sodium channel alpha subunit-like protein [Dinothrombium tinctorium]|uniref:Amiloride-sensitive sodium channel alpha subunit-like protein n=1 Tax=Dinothrombium tinctorium TaxID=1965070 RepID=A0A3S3QUV6_9ACAR|nr:amiloride-sensitive sodium channel alpha subunit-like protein [Dinothrombium tinctorium]
MGSKLTTLFKESSIPGVSTIANIQSQPRKTIWIFTLILFLILTAYDLYQIISDFLAFPIIVSVLVTDSRVLPFPGVTVCNLNPVHRGRFCSNEDIEKPIQVETILCATLETVLEVCEISKTVDSLLEEGAEICTGKKRNIRNNLRPKTVNRGSQNFKNETTGGGGGGDSGGRRRGRFPRRRGKRQLGIRDIFEAVRFFTSSGSKSGNDSGLLGGLGESGAFLENLIVQLANFAEIKINSSDELFTSQKLMRGLSTCTGPWINSILNHNTTPQEHHHDEGVQESPWYILLELLQAWLADMGRNKPSEIQKLGHQKKDLISSCYFAGKRCDIEKEFVHSFHSSYGNCYSYNVLWNKNVKEKDSLSGFTGPKFGLELVLHLETDQYMPTSKETGAKIVLHDRQQKADPDQDAIHVPPGVATYVGVQMLNISRLPAPYQDKCSDDWMDEGYKAWAEEIGYEVYTSQICLKLCLQHFILKTCDCWTISAPWPPKINKAQCNTRRNKGLFE